MIEAREGQHRGVVANASVKVVPLRANQRRTEAMTRIVSSDRWSSVTITSTLGAERAGTPRDTILGPSAQAARIAHASATDASARARLLRYIEVRRAMEQG